MRFATAQSKTPKNYAQWHQKLQLENWISAPKRKKQVWVWSTFLKGIPKGKSPAPKLRKSTDKSLSQPWCSHSSTIHDSLLQNTKVLRKQPQKQETMTKPLQCVLQHHVANPNVSTHMTIEHDNNHAAITLRSATTDSKTPKNNYAHMNNRTLQNTPEDPITHKNERTEPTSDTSCPSSPAAATAPERRLPPQNKSHATCLQPLQCVLQRHVANPHVSTHMATEHENSPSHHFFVTTSLSHHFPKSPRPLVTTSLSHHFPKSPLP